MSWESQVFLLQYQDFLHLKSDFPCKKSDLPKSAFYFLWRLSTFFNGFPLSPMAFQISPTAFRFSSTAFRFPRNPRKSIYGKKYMKDSYLSFVFFATRSPSFVITDKQYLRDYPTHIESNHDSYVFLMRFCIQWLLQVQFAAYDGNFELLGMVVALSYAYIWKFHHVLDREDLIAWSLILI